METKATRPPNDPLTNPQPGDIAREQAVAAAMKQTLRLEGE